MRLFIFAVRDRASDQFGTPMFLISPGQAIRSFTDEVNHPGEGGQRNMMYEHPDDFDLYALGEFDTNSGEFEVKKPEQVCVGKMVKVRA